MSESLHETSYQELPELTKDDRNWAMFCHLAGLLGFPVPLLGHVLGPFVVWMLNRDQHPFVDDQGKEAVNFQISMVIYFIASCCTIIGIPIAILLWFVNVVMCIIAAVRAADGEAYRYPLTIRFIK